MTKDNKENPGSSALTEAEEELELRQDKAHFQNRYKRSQLYLSSKNNEDTESANGNNIKGGKMIFATFFVFWIIAFFGGMVGGSEHYILGFLFPREYVIYLLLPLIVLFLKLGPKKTMAGFLIKLPQVEQAEFSQLGVITTLVMASLIAVIGFYTGVSHIAQGPEVLGNNSSDLLNGMIWAIYTALIFFMSSGRYQSKVLVGASIALFVLTVAVGGGLSYLTFLMIKI